MAGQVPNATRDLIMSAFRERLCERLGVTPLIHQRRWWCASEGLLLCEGVEASDGVSVQLPDGSTTRWATVPREGGRAKVIADLGAFKSGKSYGSALWLAGLAAVPGAKASLVGIEYDTVEPEFSYLCEFLLSEKGMSMPYSSMQNRPRDGKMWMELENGVYIDAKSWERKDTLKGKEKDVYLYCEAYQLPGIECYSSIKQNLVARDGYALFPTTPDRPWVKEFHEKGHSLVKGFEHWECICGIPRSQNIATYSAKEELEDAQLLTTEKFKIAHYGQLGEFVGRVYSYQRGDRQFNDHTHPDLFPQGPGRDNLRIPAGWEIVCGADTGTFYSALCVAFSPSGEAFVVDEFPNYRYVGGEPERDEQLSIPQWALAVERRVRALGGRANLWADPNSQFKGELRNYGLSLLPARVPVETRTEIAREYFEHSRIWLAPWLTTLPFELENACWPEEASLAGKFARVKDRDHTLDPLEHILARRPAGKIPRAARPAGSWGAATYGKPRRSGRNNVHLGRF